MKTALVRVSEFTGAGAVKEGSAAVFRFTDDTGRELILEMTADTAAYFVSRCQAMMIAAQTQKIAGKASDDIRRGDFLSLSLRHLISADAQPALVRHPPVVHLQLDKGHRDELNYSLDPGDAESLADRLSHSAKQVREDRKGHGQ